MKWMHSLFILAMSCGMAHAGDYLFRTFPLIPQTPTDTVTLGWNRIDNPLVAPDSAVICFGRAPGGSVPGNYPYRVSVTLAGSNKLVTTGGVAQREIRFQAKDQPNNTMGAGYFYYIVASFKANDTLVSNELNMIVRSLTAPGSLTPNLTSDQSLTELNPSFAWSKVPGVPYYHVILSDEAINIDPDNSTLEGLSIIWQAITPNTSIKYGEPDPSGTITAAPPPLSTGQDYNWMVLNNYQNIAASSDVKAPSIPPAIFRIAGDVIQKPVNVLPAAGERFSLNDGDSLITFRWNKSATANTYNLYVYMAADLGEGINAQMIVWENSTTDTFAVMNAKAILTKNKYQWKVFAVNERGAGRASDTTSFHYSAPTGQLSLSVQEMMGATPVGVSAVEVQVDVLDGSLEKPLVFYTDNSGNLNRDRPVGTYRLTTKKAGYQDQSRTVTVEEDVTETVSFVIARPTESIFGRVVEIAAGTTDSSGVNLATVTAISDRGDTARAQTDNNGYFVLSSYAENWRVSAEKNGYISTLPLDTTVTTGASVRLPSLVLRRNPNILSGTVANTRGVPILGVNVKVFRNGLLVDQVAATGENGYYAFSLPSATYTVIASKVGFTTQTRSVDLLSSKSVNLSMAPGAGVIKGNVVAKSWVEDHYVLAPLPNASITAVDSATNDTVGTTTDRTYGDYSLSLPGGQTYYLVSSKSGYTRLSSSNVVHLEGSQTVVRGDTLLALGYVKGTVRDTNGTVLSDVRISIVDSATQAIVGTGLSFSDGTYDIRGIPDGRFVVQAGKTGYFIFTPANRVVGITGGQSATLNLRMAPANKFIRWQAGDGAGNTITKATVKIKSPVLTNLDIADTLSGAGAGDYIVTVDATEASIIDLDYHRFTISASDSFVSRSFVLPATHVRVETASVDALDKTILLLSSTIDLDSAKLSFKDVNGSGYTDTTITLAGKTFSFQILPPKDGSTLFYYFTAWVGSDRYSNEKRPYSTSIPPSRNLKYSEIVPEASENPLQFPKNYQATFAVHGYNGAYESLDSLIGVSGTVTWSLVGAPAWMRMTTTPGKPLTATIAAASDTTVAPVTIKAVVKYGPVTDTVATAFVITNAVLNRLEVRRSDDLINRSVISTQQATFEVIASDSVTRRTLSVTPVWSIFPGRAGTITQMGKFQPRRSFVGQVAIRASAGGLIAQYNVEGVEDEDKGLEVVYNISASSTGDTIDNASGLKLRLPGGIIPSGSTAQLQAKMPHMERVLNSDTDIEVVGDAYDIGELNNVAFNIASDSIQLQLTIPKEVRSSRCWIASWNFDKMRWDSLPGTLALNDSLLQVNLSHFSRYAVLSLSQPVGVSEVTVTPNPFSPFITASNAGNTQPGVCIRFKPNSQVMAKPDVHVRIYTMTGDLVRTLPVDPTRVDYSHLDKGVHTIYWDGKTDHGRLARNGRYIIRISVDDGNIGEILKTVVLFK